MSPSRQLQIILGMSLLAWASQCLAMTSDHEQEIIIEADSAEFREPDGVTVYTGNVSVTQGTIQLLSDRIILHSVAGQTNRLVAEGSPANYTQTINQDGERVLATSNHMEYLTDEGILTLTEDARLTQQGTTLSGNQIVYDVRQHVLRASSQGESDRERVRVTIPPAVPRTSSEVQVP